ncbi:MAG: HD domain-containing protein [Bacteroidales bacterium]|nr:HD domain-containing protein [Bacteroidales bacterium]
MRNKEMTLASLMQAMIKYDGGDVRRIQHFVKVHDFARMIAIAEGMNDDELFVLEAAAILHDVGIHVSEEKYGNCSGKHQEELGPAEATKVLAEVDGFNENQKERICWLIAHHHTYTDVTSLDHRILLEADFLVNSFEDEVSTDGIIAFRKNVFRSPSAIKMLNEMWKLD